MAAPPSGGGCWTPTGRCTTPATSPTAATPRPPLPTCATSAAWNPAPASGRYRGDVEPDAGAGFQAAEVAQVGRGGRGVAAVGDVAGVVQRPVGVQQPPH